VIAAVAVAGVMTVCPPAGPVSPVADLDAPPPDALIACVRTTPITGQLFSHWLAISRKSVPEDPPETSRSHVMEFLLGAKWIEGEAVERGIEVSDRAVRHQLASQRREAYPNKRQFQKFLEDTGMTRSDLKYRVRLDILSDRVHKDVAGRGSPLVRERRLTRFLSRFPKKWTARTSCLAAYAGDSCGQTF
jgi:hypothetical protein